MIKEKLYFRDIDSTFCYLLEDHINEAKNEGLSEITIIEAIPDFNNKEYTYCTYNAEACEREICKKSACMYYQPSHSKGGKCKFRGKLYQFGDEITFKIENL